jgi:catechol 2,3-dioxygenase-like lactoylglutathione lyase family enzyme
MVVDIRGMVPLLQVIGMAASVAFYRGVLGFEVASTSERTQNHWVPSG